MFWDKITDYKYNTTDPPDAKLMINFMDEIHFDIHARGKSLRDTNLIKNPVNKRGILASGFTRSEWTNLLSENHNNLCDRRCLIIQEKQAGNNTTTFDIEFVAIVDILLKYKCITPTQHKIFFKKFNLF